MFRLPYEEEQYKLNQALRAEKFGDDHQFNYPEIRATKEYVEYKALSHGSAEQFGKWLDEKGYR